MSIESHDIAHDDHHDHKPSGFLDRWLFTTNHKDIGTLYLVFSLLMFFIGGSMAMVIRAELFMPGLQLVEPEFFNQMTTMHALIMVFGAVMPAWVGFANWMIPMMVGAPEQLEFLDSAVRVHDASEHAVHGFRRPRCRLDPVPASEPARRRELRICRVRNPHDGYFIHHGVD